MSNSLDEELNGNVTSANDKSTKLPAMYIFVNDEISDMQDFTLEEVGAFYLLKLHAWRNKGVIADNDDVIVRYLNCKSKRTWKKLREKLAQKLIFLEGSITMGHMMHSYNITLEKHKANIRNGSVGGKANAKNRKKEKESKPYNDSEPFINGLAAKFKQPDL